MHIFCPENIIRVATNCFVDRNNNLVTVDSVDVIQLSNLLYTTGSLPIEIAHNRFDIVSYNVVFEQREFYRLELSNGLITYIDAEEINAIGDKLKLIPVINNANSRQRVVAPKNKSDLYARYRALLMQGVLTHNKNGYLVSKSSVYTVEQDGIYVSIVNKEKTIQPYYIRFESDIRLLDIVYVV